MAIGDAATIIPTAVAAGASLTVRPGSGIEWVIHNIVSEIGYPIEVYMTDGANPIKWLSNRSGGFDGRAIHLTNTMYMTIKNTDASSRYLSYNGVVSKAV